MEVQADRSELPADTTLLKTLTLGDLVRRYRQEVTPSKRGSKVEAAVLTRFLLDPICKLPLSQLKVSDFARYRDARLKAIAPTTLKRQLNPIRHMFELAVREWAIPLAKNPIKELAFSARLRRRTRRLQPGEYSALIAAAQRCRNPNIRLVVQFALATAMRRGEIAAMQWKDLDIRRRRLLIPNTKNGHARTIPLSHDAIRSLPKQKPQPGVFAISGNAIHLAWDRVVRRSGISDLRFHDLRHEAISRFFELGLTIPEVATISGHRDATMLLSYAHANSTSVLAKLNAPSRHDWLAA